MSNKTVFIITAITASIVIIATSVLQAFTACMPEWYYMQVFVRASLVIAASLILVIETEEDSVQTEKE